MKKCLRQWHHLLKITGGDLSLSKYKISILQWKQRGLWGLLTPELIKEDDSTISISDENMNNEKLARLDPTQAERILGMRLPMSGSMEHEFEFRKNQMKALSTKVGNSPFQPHDAQMVYQSRYKAMIQYPLPLTTFTVNQLHTIQKPIAHQLLRKMGMNKICLVKLFTAPAPWVEEKSWT